MNRKGHELSIIRHGFLAIPLWLSLLAPGSAPAQQLCFRPTRAVVTHSFDLRREGTERLGARLSEAKAHDLLIISSDTTKSERAMASIANSKARFCMVADRSPVAAQTLLEAPVGAPKIFAVVPSDGESIRRVFGATGPAAEKYMKANVERFGALEHVTVVSTKGPVPFREQVIHEIDSGDRGSLFVLVAHNEEGKVMGPDGTAVTLKEINDELRRVMRPGLILSCRTMQEAKAFANSLVTTRALEFDEVAKALQGTRTKLAGTAAPNYSDYLLTLVDAFEAPAQQRKRVMVAGVAGSLLLALVSYELDCSHENARTSNPFCK